MKVNITESKKDNIETVLKIQKIFQKILRAMMNKNHFEEIWEELKDFADRAERISTGKPTEHPRTEEKGFGESLQLTPPWRN